MSHPGRSFARLHDLPVVSAVPRHPAGWGGARPARPGARWSRRPPRRVARRCRPTGACVRCPRRSCRSLRAPPRHAHRRHGLDRVLGVGSFRARSLLAGEPGMGKSTLLLQALGRMARHGARCLLVTAESAGPGAVARPAGRGARTRPARGRRDALPHVLAHVEAVVPDVLALDPDGGRPRAARCAGLGLAGPRLRVPPGATGEGAPRRPRHLVGHVTRAPWRAACARTRRRPRCCRSTATAATRSGCSATKHRFGATDELGLFEMAPAGLLDVPGVGGSSSTGAPARRARRWRWCSRRGRCSSRCSRS